MVKVLCVSTAVVDLGVFLGVIGYLPIWFHDRKSAKR